MADAKTGQCLCGAVTVTARLSDEMWACHCANCTRWSGGVQLGIEAREDTVTVAGPVKIFQSTPFSQRAWCDTCGSALWLRNTEGDGADLYEFVPGIFENAGGARLTRIVYADCAPDGFALAGDVTRVNKADYEKEFAHV